MKRPWTPGPWVEGLFYYTFSDYAKITADQQKANLKLARKSPEMAEFVIKFVESSHVQEHFDAIMLLSDLLDDAQKILEEVGYEV